MSVTFLTNEDRTHYVELGEVDIISEQEFTFSAEGTATLPSGSDPINQGLLSDYKDSLAVTLVVNGESYEGTLSSYYVTTGTISGYEFNFGGETLTLGEGATVQAGETATIRMYTMGETVHTLDPKYLPSNVPVLEGNESTDNVGYVQAISTDGSGNPNRYIMRSFSDDVNTTIDNREYDGSIYDTIEVESGATLFDISDVEYTEKFAIHCGINKLSDMIESDYTTLKMNVGIYYDDSATSGFVSFDITDVLSQISKNANAISTESFAIIGSRIVQNLWKIELFGQFLENAKYVGKMFDTNLIDCAGDNDYIRPITKISVALTGTGSGTTVKFNSYTMYYGGR